MAERPRRKRADHYHHGDLRRALLDAALAMIETDGVGAVTIRALARELGVSHAAPAHHFKDRDGLLMAVAAEGFKVFAEALEHAAATAPTPEERLVAVGVAYVRFAADHPSHLRVMFGRPPPEGTVPQDLEQKGGRAFLVLLDAVRALAPDATAVAPPLLLELATTAWSLVHGLATLWIDGQARVIASTPADLVALADRMIRSAIPGLVSRMA